MSTTTGPAGAVSWRPAPWGRRDDPGELGRERPVPPAGVRDQEDGELDVFAGNHTL